MSTTGLRMDPNKLKTIAEWAYPKNLGEIRRFIGGLTELTKQMAKTSTKVYVIPERAKPH
ncbi:hypothetical protein CROQUDRAFT_664854 [Cronartium quercuum f. sp. fusiforme G11]|uniref:Uncharacterized protein n=1 Tax=Cronartium quercuum f. sp. fusiforme G11 TaxID=708437 RepID=A0A9P6N7Z9_9BASI|nr:hypothetical protein CROQUDRAFT_664854 [Cronartium quercuum f. sp. fusiforme G11]